MFKLIAYIIDYIAYKRDKRIDKIIAVASLRSVKDVKKGDRICLRGAHDKLGGPQGKVHDVIKSEDLVHIYTGYAHQKYTLSSNDELWIVNN